MQTALALAVVLLGVSIRYAMDGNRKLANDLSFMSICIAIVSMIIHLYEYSL